MTLELRNAPNKPDYPKEVVRHWKILRSESYVSAPWGNGVGTNQIIETGPIQPHLSAGEPAWRLSTTFIRSDCSFSHYPNMDRVICLLEGDGFFLGNAAIGGRNVTPNFPVARFPGDSPTKCVIGDVQPKVLNLLLHRNFVEMSMVDLILTEPFHIVHSGHRQIAYCASGGFTVDDQDVFAGDTLLFGNSEDNPAEVATIYPKGINVRCLVFSLFSIKKFY